MFLAPIHAESAGVPTGIVIVASPTRFANAFTRPDYGMRTTVG